MPKISQLPQISEAIKEESSEKTIEKRATLPMRVESLWKNEWMSLCATSMGKYTFFPEVRLEIQSPRNQITATRTSTNGDLENNDTLLAMLESQVEEGDLPTIMRFEIGYDAHNPEIACEVSGLGEEDFSLRMADESQDVAIHWEIVRQPDKSVVLRALVGKIGGNSDMIIEMSRTPLVFSPNSKIQWKNRLSLKPA